jgi:hypothetical protein
LDTFSFIKVFIDMEFYIRKKATLPILEINLNKDGKLDYNYNKTSLTGATITISMKDVETGIYKITNGVCTYDSTNYTIDYQFTKRNTTYVGRYEVEFKVTNQQGTIILPLRDKIFVTVLDSIVESDFCC